MAERFPDDEGPVVQPSRDDERAFVRALQHRDRDAEVLFYHRYSELVERMIARIVGVDDDLPDLVHEAFCRALRAVGGLRDAEAITTWVTHIATSTAIDALRRRQTRRRWFSREPAPETEIAEPNEPEGDLDARAALRWIYKILGGLPPEERAAFVLRRIEGRELRDVASACGCSLATVKRRIARAEKSFFDKVAQTPALHEWLSARGGAK